MKSIFTPVFVSILFVALGSKEQQGSSSYDFIGEAKINYEVSYPDGKPSGPSAASFPAERTVYMKYSLARIETKTIGGTTNVIIVDSKNKIATELYEKSGKKYAIKTDSAEVQHEAEQIPFLQVRTDDEFKDIAGFNCQRQEFILTDKKHDTYKSDIYVYNDVVTSNPNWYSAQFREVSKFMFEYSVKQDGVVATFKVKLVEPLVADPSIFTVPAEYKSVSKKEFEKMQD